MSSLEIEQTFFTQPDGRTVGVLPQGLSITDIVTDNLVVNDTVNGQPIVGDFVFTTAVQTITNKTITDATNTVAANLLKTTGASVNVAASAPPAIGNILVATSATTAIWSTAAGGDVVGPGVSTDNAIARFDGVTGKIIQNSLIVIDDAGDIYRSSNKLLALPNASSIVLGNAGTAIAAGDGGNTVVGYQAMNTAFGATGNTAVGTASGVALTTGDNNTLIGNNTANSLLSGSGNVVIGVGTAPALSTGTGNVVIGRIAGSTLTTAVDAIVIGNNAGSALAANPSNTICIGSAGAAVNDSIFIGSAASTSAFVPAVYQSTYAAANQGYTTIVDGTNGQLMKGIYPTYVIAANNVSSAITTPTTYYTNPVGSPFFDLPALSYRQQATINFNLRYKSLRTWMVFGAATTANFTAQLYKNGVAFGTGATIAGGTNQRKQSALIAQADDLLAPGDLLSMTVTPDAAPIGVVSFVGWECIFELVSL